MKSNFAKCLPEILKHEGGWADHPADPGGATMKGITIGTYRQWKGRQVSKAELRAISDEEVAAIYKRNYWDKVRGDDLPAGLDLVAFDAAVNSGPSRGAKWLQTALGVAADGKVGPKTVEAALAADTAKTINLALDVRLSFLKGLKTWPTFGKGWGRRVDGVRKVALGMVGSKPAVPQWDSLGPGNTTQPVKRVPATAPKPAPQRESEGFKPLTFPPATEAPKTGSGPVALVLLAVLGAIAAAATGAWNWLLGLFN